MGLPEAAPGLFAWYTPGFSDALGDRLLLFDNTEDRPLELLRLCPAIAGAPDAESLLRARTQELATLDDDRFARVCRVDRLPQPGGGLAIVSEHVEGQRLSDFLALVSQRGGRVGAALTISVVSKLVTALGVLHRRGADLAHGALAPERLVVAPGGRVVITEQVLGPVLRELPFERDALWQRLRVALAPSPAPILDQRTDLFQVGFVAIALLLGRPLRADEDPSQASALLQLAATRAHEAGWDQARWLDFERWLSRALWLAPAEGFGDTIEAGLALESLTDRTGRAWERIAAPEPPPALPISVPPVPWPPRPRRSLPMGSRAIDTIRRARRRRRQLLAGVLSLALGVPGMYLGARALARAPQRAAPRDTVAADSKRVLPDSGPAFAVATLDLRSDPPGAVVLIDGQRRGTTPMALTDLERGEHQVRIDSDGRTVTQPVTLEPGRTATLFVPFRTTVSPAAGWLTIASPVELQAYEGDRLLGTSSSNRITLPSGRHTLSLVNEPIGFNVSRDVQVPPGRTAELELAVPNGRADINAAPWAQVWIDGQKAGDTPLSGLSLAPGRHTVTFRHPRFGERSVDCFVTLREPLRISADLTK